ncbi:FHA domain-containing protein [Variovorax sp. J22R133]|uniref:FHA domain-containing protein n=1 Tax=Variovorax brevis TaxID=3053503 RepID=UPI002575B8A8|nr:FHA domain-containing protein [Variovorax sp. J22R133]MDM0112877.1 FHA domain-containing protein [Variovorax sp. J22R133]
MSKLILFSEPNKVKQVELKGAETTIGRALENDIVVNQSRVSRRHAAIVTQGEGFIVKDLESQNGIYVNGTRIDMSHVLKHGDEIMIGDCKMRFFATNQKFSSAESLRLLTIPGSLIDLDTRRPHSTNRPG